MILGCFNEHLKNFEYLKVSLEKKVSIANTKKEKIEEEAMRKISQLDATAKRSKEEMAKLKDNIIHLNNLLSAEQEFKREEASFKANLEKKEQP